MKNNNKIEIRISGMSCTGCENRVENVLKNNIENFLNLKKRLSQNSKNIVFYINF